MTLRIYADFNSVNGPICWSLRYGVKPGDVGKPLDEVAELLNLRAGMPVVLFYEDAAEEIEVSGVLELTDGDHPRWRARADWETFRRLRG
jgi:hypothetical protein